VGGLSREEAITIAILLQEEARSLSHKRYSSGHKDTRVRQRIFNQLAIEAACSSGFFPESIAKNLAARPRRYI